MQHTTAARNAIGPLLDQLIVQLDDEGAATQRNYFRRIRACLNEARHDVELVTSIQELSSTTAFGFQLSQDADALMTRILEKTSELSRLFDEINTNRQ